jgi:murein DD-endopeptidase MepM/ murein hydrolase activator NlpD
MKQIYRYTFLIVTMLISLGVEAQESYTQEYNRLVKEIRAEYRAMVSEMRLLKSPPRSEPVPVKEEPAEELAEEVKEDDISVEPEITSGNDNNTNVDVSAAMAFAQPVATPYRVSSHFGYRRDPFTHKKAFHEGIDIPLPENTPVLATREGMVLKTGKDRHGGIYVKLKHDNGYTTLYAHLSEITTREGAKVKQGETIGLSGNTGRSTGPHLHFEVCSAEKPINPLLVLTQNFNRHEK